MSKRRLRRITAVRRIPKDLPREVIQLASELILEVARKRAPVDTGLLRDTIETVPLRDKIIIKAYVDYAIYVKWNPGDVRTQIRQAVRAFKPKE